VSNFQGKKEGYYYSTGLNGTGYYLDSKFWDFNDADNEGYVLVRTAPAVAVHRAMKRREQHGTLGLLFSTKLMEALGAAHGDPEGHRYKLLTPPWMGGARPPVETFEKKDEAGKSQLFGRNELLYERFEYLKTQMISRTEKQIAVNRREAANEVVLNSGRKKKLLDVNDEIVVVNALAGPLKLFGPDLLPLAPNKGPWIFMLELFGPEAKKTPLKFKATLKKVSLRWQVSRLLELFLERYKSKYPDDPHFEINHLRLHLTDSTYASPDTLLAEIIQRWDGNQPHASHSVRIRRGAGTDAQPRISTRSKAIAKRDALKINEWSTQSQVLAVRKRDKKPMTSEELRAYWEERKDEKHWRTDAALRGYYTRTEDPAKLQAWSKIRLFPKHGFFLDGSIKSTEQSSSPIP